MEMKVKKIEMIGQVEEMQVRGVKKVGKKKR